MAGIGAGGHGRLYRAGDQFVDADLVLPDLLRQHTGQHPKTGLGAGVGRIAATAMAHPRPDHDDLAGAPLLEIRHGRSSAIVGRDQIGFQRQPPHCRIALCHRASIRVDAGVDDDNIDAAKVVRALPEQLLNGSLLRNIGGNSQPVAALRCNLLNGCVDLTLCPRGTNHRCTRSPIRQGNRTTNAPSRSGDDGDFAGQWLIRCRHRHYPFCAGYFLSIASLLVAATLHLILLTKRQPTELGRLFIGWKIED